MWRRINYNGDQDNYAVPGFSRPFDYHSMPKSNCYFAAGMDSTAHIWPTTSII